MDKETHIKIHKRLQENIDALVKINDKQLEVNDLLNEKIKKLEKRVDTHNFRLNNVGRDLL